MPPLAQDLDRRRLINNPLGKSWERFFSKSWMHTGRMGTTGISNRLPALVCRKPGSMDGGGRDPGGWWIGPLRKPSCLMFDTRKCLNRSTPFPALSMGSQGPDSRRCWSTTLAQTPTTEASIDERGRRCVEHSEVIREASTSLSSHRYLPYLLTDAARPCRPTYPVGLCGRGTKRRDRQKSWLCWRPDTDLLISDTDQRGQRTGSSDCHRAMTYERRLFRPCSSCLDLFCDPFLRTLNPLVTELRTSSRHCGPLCGPNYEIIQRTS